MTRSSGPRFARPSLLPRIHRESRNPSESRNPLRIQEPIVNPGAHRESIVNPGIHRESRNPSWIQEPIVNPGTHCDSRNPSWIQEIYMYKREIRYVFEDSAPEHFVYTILHHFARRTTFRKMTSRRITTFFSGSLEVHIYMYILIWGILSLSKHNGIWCEMVPYDSVWAHIKTGRSPVAQDHF